MKKLIYSILVVLFVCSCNESYIDRLNHKVEITEVQHFTYELVDGDYKALVAIEEANTFAQTQDTAAFKAIEKNKYFVNEDEAKMYLPYLLKYRMPYLSEGSVVNLKYNLYTQVDDSTFAIVVDSLTFRRMASMEWIPLRYYLIEPFDNSQGDFTIENVYLQNGLTSVWSTTAKYGMKATAFVKPNNMASESWLISPSMDFSEAISPVISFEQVGNFLPKHDSLSYKEVFVKTYKVLVSTNYVDNVAGAHWDTIPYLKDDNNEYQVPSNSYDFIPTGNLDLSSVVGAHNVRVAFRYVSDTLAAGTWEIKNIEIRENW